MNIKENRNLDLRNVFSDITETVLPILENYRETIDVISVTKKEDDTLLTKADLEVQDSLVKIIKQHNPRCNIIAEERRIEDNKCDPNNIYTWIIDPIDGTKEFISAEGCEFCTSICVLEKLMPIGAIIIMPELGRGNKPVVIEAVAENNKINEEFNVFINGMRYPAFFPSWKIPKNISMTRHGNKPMAIDNILRSYGCKLKTKTTSQTIDLVRVSVDPKFWGSPNLEKFDIFYREDQKLWDGAPGIFINNILGRISVNSRTDNILPFNRDTLDKSIPILPVSMVGMKEHVYWMVDIMKNNQLWG